MVAEPTEHRPTQWLSGPEQDVWRRVLSVQCRLRERLDQELRSQCNLTLAEYDVLVHLSEAPARALRMSELAARLLLSKSGLTRRVDGLVREGLVVRRPCDDDGRGALAELTSTGWGRIQLAAPVHVAGVRRYLFDPISATAGRTGPEDAERPGPGEQPDSLAGLAKGLANIQRALADG